MLNFRPGYLRYQGNYLVLKEIAFDNKAVFLEVDHVFVGDFIWGYGHYLLQVDKRDAHFRGFKLLGQV